MFHMFGSVTRLEYKSLRMCGDLYRKSKISISTPMIPSSLQDFLGNKWKNPGQNPFIVFYPFLSPEKKWYILWGYDSGISNSKFMGIYSHVFPIIYNLNILIYLYLRIILYIYIYMGIIMIDNRVSISIHKYILYMCSKHLYPSG